MSAFGDDAIQLYRPDEEQDEKEPRVRELMGFPRYVASLLEVKRATLPPRPLRGFPLPPTLSRKRHVLVEHEAEVDRERSQRQQALSDLEN